MNETECLLNEKFCDENQSIGAEEEFKSTKQYSVIK